MNALAHYYAAAASAFHEIFYYKLTEKIFSRNYSGKVPLFSRKFPEKFRRKFPKISELTTLDIAGRVLLLTFLGPAL